MRTNNGRCSLIDSIMPRTRQAILAATLLRPDTSWYLTALARHLKRRPSSLQRELTALVQAGILTVRREGRMVYFQADPNCPVLPELQGLLSKTSGLLDVLRAALDPVTEQVMCAFVYGSIARSQELSGSDVDLLIVAEVGLKEIAPLLSAAQEKLGREVNPKLYRRAEFAKRLAAKDHFLVSVLQQPKLFVIGNERELEQVAGRKAGHVTGARQE